MIASGLCHEPGRVKRRTGAGEVLLDEDFGHDCLWILSEGLGALDRAWVNAHLRERSMDRDAASDVRPQQREPRHS